MASTAETLAQAHRINQVKQSTITRTILARQWSNIIDPSDIEGSFQRFLKVARPIIRAGRLESADLAQAYYRAVRDMSGLGPGVALPVPTIPDAQLDESLHATGVASLKRELARGRPEKAAIARSGVSMSRAAQRQRLNAGRQLLIELAHHDDDVRGWARTGDGDPCYFCAMLISRGPVYGEATVDFAAHDGDGCGVRMVMRDDPDGGWSPEARKFRKLWDQQGALAWRPLYESAYGDPTEGQLRTALDVLKNPDDSLARKLRGKLREKTAADSDH